MLNTKELALRDVQEDMILATDVYDNNGNVLLAAGIKLSYATLTALARHGVATVTVEQVQEISEDRRMMLHQEIEHRLNDRFRQAGDDVIMNHLKEALINHRTGRLQ